MNSFLDDNFNFEIYSPEHIIGVISFAIFGILIIWIGKKNKSAASKRTILLYFTFAIFLSQIAKVVILLSLGRFDEKTDIPLQLCNVAPLILWFAYYFRSRALWGIIFMWIMAGTIQSNFTPTLEHSFPHFEWFRYWIIHVLVVIAVIYGFVVLDYRLKWKDIFISLFWLNIFALIVYPINLWLDANYLFLVEKPNGKTMFDLLGKWPYYILQLEFVAILLFSLLYLPFHFWRKNPMKVESNSQTLNQY
ncbi:MAG TPA: TIGR02206 family membrane protein [Saprospirales bacterium]|nr:TIGR02206 family membrane protein [Saprospirales bacterium]